MVVLRPEPGNARTAAAIEALGHRAIRLPLFAVTPVAWTPPSGRFDALMLTSANAVRHVGPLPDRLRALPVIAVGAVTAATARAAGLHVTWTGDGDAAALVEAARALGLVAPLHLAGRDRASVPGVTAITVYASDPVPIDPTALHSCEGAVVLLHSVRAARRFALLADEAGVQRERIRLAGLSQTAVLAAGEGWRAAVHASRPIDAMLVARAVALAD